MKLTIDRNKKEIQVEEEVTLGSLVEELEDIFPNGQWADYKLVKKQCVEWVPIWDNPFYPKTELLQRLAEIVDR